MALLIALTGGLPDLIPAWQTLHGNWSGLYRWCHSFLWWRDILVPTWGLHLLLDRVTHKPTGGWYAWVWWVDALLLTVAVVWVLWSEGWLRRRAGSARLL